MRKKMKNKNNEKKMKTKEKKNVAKKKFVDRK